MEQINESLGSAPPPPAPFNITDAAVVRIAHLLKDEPAGSYFVVEVQGGGCSGFQYHFDLKPATPGADDLVIDRLGARVLVDDVSLDILKGSVLDYSEDLASAGFEIKNPNATASCGCGNSFSVM